MITVETVLAAGDLLDKEEERKKKLDVWIAAQQGKTNRDSKEGSNRESLVNRRIALTFSRDRAGVLPKVMY